MIFTKLRSLPPKFISDSFMHVSVNGPKTIGKPNQEQGHTFQEDKASYHERNAPPLLQRTLYLVCEISIFRLYRALTSIYLFDVSHAFEWNRIAFLFFLKKIKCLGSAFGPCALSHPPQILLCCCK